MNNTVLWVSFNAFVLIMLALDLGVFHKKSREVTIKEALGWTGVWIALALLFNLFLYHFRGKEKAIEFLTGYLIEKSLSVDNIFVIIMIFAYFSVPRAFQHKVLFWGILGALVMRIIFIFAGVELLQRFHWLIYIFGSFLIITGIRMLRPNDSAVDPTHNPLVKLSQKIFRITPSFYGDRFFVRLHGLLWATPLFLVVVMIETTDLIFAIDSIPAILAVSDDPFIVYTSNVFAILGLRSLYFALSGIESYCKYLKYGLATILVFVGAKMCLTDFVKIPVEISLVIIVFVLGISMSLSLYITRSRAQSPKQLTCGNLYLKKAIEIKERKNDPYEGTKIQTKHA